MWRQNICFSFEDDDYQPSDSDDEYTETEKKLLKKVVNRQNDDSDTEVSESNIISSYLKL